MYNNILLSILILIAIFLSGLLYLIYKLFKQVQASTGNKIISGDERAEKAVDILEEANFKAREIINEFAVFNAQAKEQLADAVKKVISIDPDSGNLLKKEISQTVEANVVQATGIFKGVLESEVTEFERQANLELARWRERFELEEQQLEKELQQFRNQQYAQLERRLTSTIEDLTRDILGQSINPEQHKDLIKKSIQKAKEENAF